MSKEYMNNKNIKPFIAVHDTIIAQKTEDDKSEVSELVDLQIQLGNRAIQRLLAQRSDEGPSELDDTAANRINQARGGGQALDNAVQKQMSQATGQDFDGVNSPLTTEERDNLITWIVEWQIPLTGDRDQNITLLTERILCGRLEAIDHSDPLFCVDSEVTRSDPSFAIFRDAIIAPAYDRIPQDVARELLERFPTRRRQRGRNPVREQLEQIAESGGLTQGERTVTLSGELLLTLQTLARAVGTSERGRSQFGIISLIRPHSHGLHSQGRAVDINIYAGKRLDARWPYEAIEGVIALIDNLPRGYFVLGLPRVPGRNFHDFNRYPYYFEPYSHDPPIFKRQYRNREGQFGLPNHFLNKNLEPRRSPSGGNVGRDIDRFEDETAKSLFREAVNRARAREVHILYIFPDAPNHVHLSTGSTAEALRRG